MGDAAGIGRPVRDALPKRAARSAPAIRDRARSAVFVGYGSSAKVNGRDFHAPFSRSSSVMVIARSDARW